MAAIQQKIAIVTGANKGIGFEICRQLASKGVTVILTARDERRGLESLEKLRKEYADSVLFHRLDVSDSKTLETLVGFVQSRFGKLDILVNNAGIGGVTVDVDAVRAAAKTPRTEEERAKIDWDAITTETYDLALETLQTNYYGAKRTAEAFLPILQLSSSPRIVNVSSTTGKLKNIQNEWAKGVLRDDENLTEERIDEVLNEYLKDFRDGSAKARGWPWIFGAYTISKAALNSYTRILAKKLPAFQVNSVCPGFVDTEINYHCGVLTVEEGAANPVKLALLPDDGPSGLFFDRNEISSFEE